MTERSAEVTSRIMSSIPSKNTRPELLLRKALWQNNLRFRVNYRRLPGKPDIVFTRWKIAIFCDGDFWHGHNWVLRGMGSLEEELSRYSDFWRNKILRNVARDEEITKELRGMGWTVIRIWESDIKKDLASCVLTVKEALFAARLSEDDLCTDDQLSK